MSVFTESAMEGTRVLIVDDDRLFAEVILLFLSDYGMEVLDSGAGRSEAIEAARRTQPHLVLVDVDGTGPHGLEIGRSILMQQSEARIVALTSSSDAVAAEEAIQAGFHGYLTKDTPLSQFVTSIGAVLDGSVVVLHQLLPERRVNGWPARERAASRVFAQLTSREWQMLELVAEGLSTSAIAQRLNISAHTVRSHTQNMMNKLQVHSRLQATALAARYGVLRPSSKQAPA